MHDKIYSFICFGMSNIQEMSTSLTAIPCKLLEHIVFSKTWQHLNNNNIISSKQHGFRRGMSCETQLVEALHKWTSVMNKGSNQIDAIVLDFSKAFDMVPHQRLLEKTPKLRHYRTNINMDRLFPLQQNSQCSSRWCEITNRTRYIWRSSRHSARSPVVSHLYKRHRCTARIPSSPLRRQ